MTTPTPPVRPGPRREPRVLRVRTPEDLLAAVPALLGFHPSDSVVLVTAGTARTPVHARVDLPASPRRTEEIAAITDDLADVAGRSGLVRAAVVLYTDDVRVAGAVGTALVAALERVGVAVVLVMRADGERWFWHEDDGAAIPHVRGHRYELASHPLTVQAVVDGQVVHASRAALKASLRWRDPAAVAAVQAAVERHVDTMVERVGGHRGRRPRSGGRVPAHRPAARDHLEAEARWAGQRVRRYLADRSPLDADDAARLLVGMIDLTVRDAAWAQMQRDSVSVHVDLWRDLLVRSPEGLAAAPAALLAFAAWLSGDGALAWCAVDRCREERPEYGLAGLVAEALAGAVPPSAWTPPDAWESLPDEPGEGG